MTYAACSGVGAYKYPSDLLQGPPVLDTCFTRTNRLLWR
jgi:hypothetical protein